MGILDHLICPLRNLNAEQEATVITGSETTDWFKIGKGVHQDCILSPCLFNLYAEYIMPNAGLDEAQLESRFPGEILITLDMLVNTTLMAESKEELKSLFMRMEEESEKSWLKTQHSKNKDHGIWSQGR